MKRASNRASLGPLVVVLLLSASCGGSSGGSGHEELTGSVRSPGGVAIGLVAAQAPRLAPAPAGAGRATLELDGLLPVPDGTAVALVRLDAAGAVLETLASTTTAAGAYTFDLSVLQLELASDLALLAGSGASALRAPAVRDALDVDPLSEALVQMMLESAPLTNYTLTEQHDLLGALELHARANDLSAQGDVPTTIDAWKQSAHADVDFENFLAATLFPGDAGVGPGDVGDYFPS